MILVKLFRPDRLLESTEGYINNVFRTDLTAQTDYDFREVIQKTSTALTPIALVSVPGYDASYKVEQLVKQVNVRCTSIAMGSAEGISQADFARHLNVGTKLVSDWERGAKRPSGPSLKLLAPVKVKGLETIA